MSLIEKLSPEDLASQNKCKVGKAHPVRQAIAALQKGEGIRISAEAFRWKNRTPHLFCLAISKKSKKKFTTSKLLTDQGKASGDWIVERIE